MIGREEWGCLYVQKRGRGPWRWMLAGEADLQAEHFVRVLGHGLFHVHLWDSCTEF